MNKEQLIAKAAQKRNVPRREIRDNLNAVIEVLVEALENDTNIAIAGLGTFQVKRRGKTKKVLPINGKVPDKGESVETAMFTIPERKYIKFNPAPHIKRNYSDNSSYLSEPEVISKGE